MIVPSLIARHLSFYPCQRTPHILVANGLTPVDIHSSKMTAVTLVGISRRNIPFLFHRECICIFFTLSIALSPPRFALYALNLPEIIHFALFATRLSSLLIEQLVYILFRVNISNFFILFFFEIKFFTSYQTISFSLFFLKTRNAGIKRKIKRDIFGQFLFNLVRWKM